MDNQMTFFVEQNLRVQQSVWQILRLNRVYCAPRLMLQEMTEYGVFFDLCNRGKVKCDWLSTECVVVWDGVAYSNKSDITLLSVVVVADIKKRDTIFLTMSKLFRLLYLPYQENSRITPIHSRSMCVHSFFSLYYLSRPPTFILQLQQFFLILYLFFSFFCNTRRILCESYSLHVKNMFTCISTATKTSKVDFISIDVVIFPISLFLSIFCHRLDCLQNLSIRSVLLPAASSYKCYSFSMTNTREIETHHLHQNVWNFPAQHRK